MATSCPEQLAYGASNLDLWLYAQQLELALVRCNRDKADISLWSTNLAKAGVVK